MRYQVLVGIGLASLVLFGCSRKADDVSGGWFDFGGGANAPGRYASVGVYSPSRQWTRLIANQEIKDKDAARPIDDQEIIVVENSTTGEVRACGDLTGYCIGMNPWKSQLLSSQVAPVKLTKHVPPDGPDATETPASSAAPTATSGAKPAG